MKEVPVVLTGFQLWEKRFPEAKRAIIRVMASSYLINFLEFIGPGLFRITHKNSSIQGLESNFQKTKVIQDPYISITFFIKTW
jgi:hypothetical protein